MKQPPAKPQPPQAPGHLLGDIRQLIEQSRQHLASAVNSALTTLYWHIGQRIRSEVLQDARAGYGEQIVATLSKQLEKDYGRGFSEKNLRHMLRFAEVFPEVQIVSAARRQLSWTHFRTLIYIGDPLKRDFYLQMCQQEGWSTRTLQERLDSQLFERTALSRQPDALLAQELASLRQNGELHPGLVLKDPYVLDFLGLQDRYLEKDLEDAILRELEHFLLELGAGFSFVARQKRIQIDHEDFYIDLLFYHVTLKCYVVVELKNRKFIPEYAGKLNFYLSAVDSLLKRDDDQPTIGLLLCRDKNNIEVEFALRDMNKPMGVSEYTLLETLPDNLKGALPTVEEIEAELTHDHGDAQ